MALVTLAETNEIDGLKILHTDGGKMCPNDTFVQVYDSTNVIAFKIQNGPIKEYGLNGCQVTDMIVVAKHIIEKLNEKFPCIENEKTLDYLDLALNQQRERTRQREARGVEGLSQL